MNRKRMLIIVAALAAAILIVILILGRPREDEAEAVIFPDAPDVDVAGRESFTIGDSGIPLFLATPEERERARRDPEFNPDRSEEVTSGAR